MTDSHNIFHGFVPDLLPQLGFELADRWKTQYIVFLLVALCTMGVHAQVGQAALSACVHAQAGIGAVDQVQVSNYSPVPQDAVSAQPQMLLFILDQPFNRQAAQIIRDHLLGPLEGLGVVEDQVDRFAAPIDAIQQTQGDALKYTGLFEATTPEEHRIFFALSVITTKTGQFEFVR